MILEKENSIKNTLKIKEFDGIGFYEIEDVDKMPPFFMTILSASNHWMFISSNGALTAGRKNTDYALFPYYTDDKIIASKENTGCKTIIKGTHNGNSFTWEPFSDYNQSRFKIQRNLYKSIYGNEIIFEENNFDLNLTFQYKWSNSNTYGFIRKAKLINNSLQQYNLEILDGFQNVLPAGVGSDLQNLYSNLVDAYKRTELVENTQLALFTLSAIIVDRAEPSEALKANTIWSFGLENATVLLSNLQLENFRNTQKIIPEIDSKGEKGAYLITSKLELHSNTVQEWFLAANTNQNHAQVITLIEKLKEPYQFINEVLADVNDGTQKLLELVNAADGIQLTADNQKNSRHFANVLFNCMRGGIFDNNYQISKLDFSKYLQEANVDLATQFQKIENQLPNSFTIDSLKETELYKENIDFQRHTKEYLPLYFSRRHGDPSRPWNKFSINTQNEVDGSKILDYQGNWRDIFQNWEALAYSYPNFTENMLFRFLNASTFEGYNPYRITKDGFDWEIVEPDNPWAYIGYWGDHQIIYLLKFLEFIENCNPEKLQQLFDKEIFVYANVPYKIKKYETIVSNPKDTISFDFELDEKLRKNKEKTGADAFLIANENHEIHHVNFIEKILVTVLSKMSNLIPEAGIWMNTQRPEWNDANNALVGNGVSMVTLYYLRRFLVFFQNILEKTTLQEIKISQELIDFYKNTRTILEENSNLLNQSISNEDRKKITDSLGKSASSYRWHVYQHGFWGKKRSISVSGLQRFISVSINYLEHSIKANKRNDGLYHAYNLASFETNTIAISHLEEMLEGQVAALSSGYLSTNEVLEIVESLKNSALYRKDQNSYLLYPNKELPKFLDKNKISKHEIQEIALLNELANNGNFEIVEQDVWGNFHFNGNFKNATDLKLALEKLDKTKYSHFNENQSDKVLHLFEKTFNHKAFTGRSGTFYGYEGLGSIYWHMVSKLLLAIGENVIAAHKNNEPGNNITTLISHYYDVYNGLGIHKSAQQYGAFPTDPYSHTPASKGAQQPGMTGQVKEDIICRWGELGINISNGSLGFNPFFLLKSEFLKEAADYQYYNLNNELETIHLEPNTLAFTYCKTPIVYKIGNKNHIEVVFDSGEKLTQENFELPTAVSTEIFNRTGKIKVINITISQHLLSN